MEPTVSPQEIRETLMQLTSYDETLVEGALDQLHTYSSWPTEREKIVNENGVQRLSFFLATLPASTMKESTVIAELACDLLLSLLQMDGKGGTLPQPAWLFLSGFTSLAHTPFPFLAAPRHCHALLLLPQAQHSQQPGNAAANHCLRC